MRHILISAVLAAAAAGCAGPRFSFDDARRVQVGWTVEQLQRAMGRPYRVVSRHDSQIWIWSHANGMTGAARSVSFVVRDGAVVVTPAIPTDF